MDFGRAESDKEAAGERLYLVAEFSGFSDLSGGICYTGDGVCKHLPEHKTLECVLRKAHDKSTQEDAAREKRPRVVNATLLLTPVRACFGREI